MLNHSFINNAMAHSHMPMEDHGLFETTHIHFDIYIVLESESGIDDSDLPLDHEHIAHIHIHGDCYTLLNVPHFEIAGTDTQSSHFSPIYLGLTYKPAVPPPNA